MSKTKKSLLLFWFLHWENDGKEGKWREKLEGGIWEVLSMSFCMEVNWEKEKNGELERF